MLLQANLRWTRTTRWPRRLGVKSLTMPSGSLTQPTLACMLPPVMLENLTSSGRALSRKVGLMAGMQANRISLLGPRLLANTLHTVTCTLTPGWTQIDTFTHSVMAFTTATAGTAACPERAVEVGQLDTSETTPAPNPSLSQSVPLIHWVDTPTTPSTLTPSILLGQNTAPTRPTTSWTWALTKTGTWSLSEPTMPHSWCSRTKSPTPDNITSTSTIPVLVRPSSR